LDFIEIVYRDRKTVIAITLLFTIFGIVYSFLATPYFKASTSLYFVSGDGEQETAGLVASLGFGNLIQNQANYNIKDVLYSNLILEKTVLNKWQTAKETNKKIDLIEFWEMENETKELGLEKAVLRFKKSILNFNFDDETGLIKITVLMKEAQLAADVLSFMVNEINEYIMYKQNSSIKQSIAFIEKRLEKVKYELNEKEEKLKLFALENRDFMKSPTLFVEYNRLKREVEIKNEAYLTIIKQKELLMIREVKKLPVISILDRAKKTEKKAKPNKKIIVISFCFASLFFSVILVFFKVVYLRDFISRIKGVK